MFWSPEPSFESVRVQHLMVTAKCCKFLQELAELQSGLMKPSSTRHPLDRPHPLDDLWIGWRSSLCVPSASETQAPEVLGHPVSDYS